MQAASSAEMLQVILNSQDDDHENLLRQLHNSMAEADDLKYELQVFLFILHKFSIENFLMVIIRENYFHSWPLRPSNSQKSVPRLR